MATRNTPKPRRTFGQRLARFVIANAITLAVVFALALPLSYLVGQRILRARQLDKLTHTDPQVFDEGLGYLLPRAVDEPWALDAATEHIDSLPPDRAIRLLAGLGAAFALREEPIPDAVFEAGGRLLVRVDFAQKFVVYNYLKQFGRGEDPRVVAALASTLDTPDDRRFLRAVEFYDTQFLWLPEHVPAEHWLRWAVLLSHSEAALTQLRAAQVLGEAIGSIDDPRIADGLLRLAGSDNPAVRSEALDAAAGFAKVADDPVPYEQVLIALTEDDNETLARRAWITLGLLNPLSGFSADWRSVEPAIAEAMLWAVVKTNPDHLQPAFDAMETEGYRAAGTLALGQRRQRPPHVYEEDLAIQRVVEDGPEQDTLAVWRAILVSRDYQNGEATAIYRFLGSPTTDDEFGNLHFAGRWIGGAPYPPSEAEAPFFQQLLLAHLEGLLDHGYMDRVALFEIADDWPLISILAGGLLKQDEPPALYRDAFSAYASNVRDLAVLAAVESDGTAQFIHEQLRSRKIEAVLASALLAGMTGAQPQFIEGNAAQDKSAAELLAMSDAELADIGLGRVDALTTLLDIAESAPDRENRNEQIALLKLALWMRGDLGDAFIPEAERMLADDRLPTSTVLMCLLYMQRPAALYYLFDDPDAASGESPLDLYDLFVNQRWWHVFSRLVPDRDLELWLWGDPGAQSFQFEVMRQWVQTNRWRLEDGWWPGELEAE